MVSVDLLDSSMSSYPPALLHLGFLKYPFFKLPCILKLIISLKDCVKNKMKNSQWKFACVCVWERERKRERTANCKEKARLLLMRSCGKWDHRWPQVSIYGLHLENHFFTYRIMHQTILVVIITSDTVNSLIFNYNSLELWTAIFSTS